MSAARSSTGTATTAIADRYRGRFAPSPTGPLHFGSLVAAVGSRLEALVHRGSWSLRIENVDRTREIPGAADVILRQLEAFGCEWDGPVVFQSDRTAAYAGALERLEGLGLVYPCTCSRAELAARQDGTAFDEPSYPGTCREGVRHPGRPHALRFRVPAGTVTFDDALQGRVSRDVASDPGDFVIRRKDGYFAYQLAVVVDDADLRVTDVVRGADLLDTTPRQLLLQRALGFPEPRYLHLPLAVDSAGRKLSKSSQSLAVDPAAAGPLLWKVLAFLRQDPPAELAGAAPAILWQWAQANWTRLPLNGLRTLAAPAP